MLSDAEIREKAKLLNEVIQEANKIATELADNGDCAITLASEPGFRTGEKRLLTRWCRGAAPKWISVSIRREWTYS